MFLMWLLVGFGFILSIALSFSHWKKTWRFLQCAKNIPGPNWVPVIGNLFDAVANKYDTIKVMSLYTNKFKDREGIVKFWRGNDLFVAISDPNFMHIYFNSPALSKRSEFYDTFDSWLGSDNVLSAHYEPWKKVRKMLSHAFNGLPQNLVISRTVEEANNLVEQINKFHRNTWTQSEPIIAQSINTVFTKIAFDEDITEYTPLLYSLMETYDILKTVILRVISPLHFLNITFPMTKEARRFENLTVVIRKGVQEIVEKKKTEYDEILSRGEKPPDTYVNNILQSYGTLSLHEVTNQLITMYAAGVDTTVSTMSFLLTMIGIHKDVQERIFHEDQEIQAKLAGKPMETNDFAEYKYLERVIKETLRLFPVFPIIGRVAEQDVQMGKYIIPEGTNVLLVLYWTHRRGDIFRDPLKFDPDRHLPEIINDLHPHAFSPFSSGPKGCIGTKYAMMSLKTYVMTLVRHFKIHSIYGSVEDVDKHVTVTVTMHDNNKCSLRFEKRI